MSNKQTMKRAGRRVRKAFDAFISELEAAQEANVGVNCNRYVDFPKQDGGSTQVVDPDPMSTRLADAEYLKSLKFTFRVVETLEESELEDEAEDGATA